MTTLPKPFPLKHSSPFKLNINFINHAPTKPGNGNYCWGIHLIIFLQVQRLKVLTAPPSIERFTGNSKSANSGKKVPEFYILRGDNLTVSCDVTRGIPFPQISWKRRTVRGIIRFCDFAAVLKCLQMGSFSLLNTISRNITQYTFELVSKAASWELGNLQSKWFH